MSGSDWKIHNRQLIATIRTLSGWCYGEDREQFNRNRNKNRSLQICLDWGWQAKQTSNAKRSGHASLCVCVPFLQKFSFMGFNPRHDYSRLSPWASVGTQVPQTPHTCTACIFTHKCVPPPPAPRAPSQEGLWSRAATHYWQLGRLGREIAPHSLGCTPGPS